MRLVVFFESVLDFLLFFFPSPYSLFACHISRAVDTRAGCKQLTADFAPSPRAFRIILQLSRSIDGSSVCFLPAPQQQQQLGASMALAAALDALTLSPIFP